MTSPAGGSDAGWIDQVILTPYMPVITQQPQSQVADFDALVTFTVAADYAEGYQWQKDGVDISGETGSSFTITNTRLWDAGDYTVIVSNYNGSVTSDIATLTVLSPTIPQAADSSLTFVTGGTTDWFGQTIVTHDGIDAAQSGDIGDFESTWLETTVTGPGSISFWWKVSSEQDYDFLRFSIDGVKQTSISGEVDWERRSYDFGDGTYTLNWTYYKDDATSAGSDAGWLDELVFAPYLPVITVAPMAADLHLSFLTVADRTYRLMRNDNTPDLSDGGWMDAGQPPITGDGAVMNFTVPKPATGQVFYTIEYEN